MDSAVEMEKCEEMSFLGLSLTYLKHCNSMDLYYLQEMKIRLVWGNLYFDEAVL